MTDLTWIAQTILAMATLLGSVVSAIIALKTLKRQEIADTKLDEVKRSTDGLLHTAKAEAEEKGRKEGAALATAGVAAAKS